MWDSTWARLLPSQGQVSIEPVLLSHWFDWSVASRGTLYMYVVQCIVYTLKKAVVLPKRRLFFLCVLIKIYGTLTIVCAASSSFKTYSVMFRPATATEVDVHNNCFLWTSGYINALNIWNWHLQWTLLCSSPKSCLSYPTLATGY